jgi:serine/threonine-protein kinase
MAKSSVVPAAVTAAITTVAVFFVLRTLEQRGVIPPVAKSASAPAPAPAAPPSTPSGPVDVPSLLGMRADQARELLAGRGLLLAFSVEREDAQYPAGTVAEQVPLPGSQLPKGGAVQAVLSRGAPAQKPIPKLTGLRLRAAKELLGQQGFKAGKIRYDSDGDRSAGVVLDQKPAPPATALAGTAVDLTVNED